MKRHLKRLFIMLFVLALPGLACNLSESPTPVPTAAPPPVLQNPVVGLNPVSGPPGTIINVNAAGFPSGAQVNLFLSPINGANPSPVASNLTIGTGGILSFALQLPNNINGNPLTGTTDLNFTVSTVDNSIHANAIFVAIVGGGTPTQASQTAGGSGGTGALFITSPNINEVVTGNAVTVTGSGSALNNKVGVQVLDSTYKVLGSAIATIQAGAGAVGPWQTTVGFTPPAGTTVGYIVAYTVNAQGGIADQASIPITLTGQAAPTAAPASATVRPPTVQ